MRRRTLIKGLLAGLSLTSLRASSLSDPQFVAGLIPSASGPTLPNVPGLILWLKADAITGLTDGQTATSWADSSGNGNNYAGSANKPVYKTNRLNGYPSVFFTAASQQRLTRNPINTGNAFSWFLVFKFTATNVYSPIYSSGEVCTGMAAYGASDGTRNAVFKCVAGTPSFGSSTTNAEEIGRASCRERV